jgi:hypothetical protein
MSIVDPVFYNVLANYALLTGDSITSTNNSDIWDGYWGGPDPAKISPNLRGLASPQGPGPNNATAATQLTQLVADLKARPVKNSNFSGVGTGGNITLGRGVYRSTDKIEFADNSSITFDAGGDAGAQFVIIAETAITFIGTISIVLISNAQLGNIVWLAGTNISFTGLNVAQFSGILIANNNISYTNSARVDGRIFTQVGSISLVSTRIIAPTPVASCFNKRTFLLTEHGYRAVETLEVGDSIQTFGDITKSTVTLREPSLKKCISIEKYYVAFPDESNGLICFKSGSLGEGLPEEDLYVSPEHGMINDGCLVGAKTFVNGDTIFQDLTKKNIEYFHVEVESHSCLKANGVLAESFLR